MRTAPAIDVKETTDQSGDETIKSLENSKKGGYISVIKTRVRLVQKKSSRQATLG